MKKQITLQILDWAYKVNKDNFDTSPIVQFLQKHLGQKYDFKYSNRPQYLLYGPFGDSHLDYDESCVRIFCTGENLRTDWNLADYGIDYDLFDFGGGRHLHYPLYFYCQSDLKNALKKHLRCDSRGKFCAFVVSNGIADRIRGTFFDELSKYKRVDSGGAYKNNIGAPVGDKQSWLQNYKFNLCFENSAHNGYVTEKLIQAFAGGCIPIYWGDESLCNEKYAHIRPIFNEKAFINVHNFNNIQSAIREIQRIDSDENAYNAMRKEPIFTLESMERFFGLNPKDDLWSSANIEHTAESIINHSESILANFFDNIFTKGKQIKYAQHISAYFAQRRMDRRNRAWQIWLRKNLWNLRCAILAPLKKMRDLWRKMRYCGRI